MTTYPTYAQEYKIESVTDSQLKWDNRTITNVFVTMTKDNSSTNSHDNPNFGEIMISSATVIGFVGLGSIFGSSFSVKTIRVHIITVITLFTQVAILVTLHLLVILSAFNGSLDGGFYTNVIYATIYLIIGILASGAYLTIMTSSYDYRLHKINARIENLSGADEILRETILVSDDITKRESVGVGPLDNFLPK